MGLGRDFLAYFEPVNKDSVSGNIAFDYPTLLDNLIFLDNDSKESVLDQAQIVIFAYPGSAISKKIRRQLYALSSHFPSGSIVDLGNLRKGKTKADTARGVQDVVEELGRLQKTIVVLGGKPEDTINLYDAYSLLEQPVNICGIDAGIPLSSSEKFPKSHYLNKILLNSENKLFDYTHLAYQAYFTSPSVVELIEKLFFNHIRLGRLRQDIREAEPEFRNTDILSFSMSAIRGSDAPSSEFPGPNGLYAEEACQLGRYAGLSERVRCLFINGLSLKPSDNQITEALTAQIIWHFLQGFFHRKKENPYTDISTFQKFIVNVPQVGHDIHFFKSPKTNRWWIEVPYPSKKNKRSLFVACSPSDYQAACEGEIPDRWWKNIQRLS